MPSRRRKAQLVKESRVAVTETTFATIYNKPATLATTVTSASPVRPANSTRVSTESLQKVSGLIFTLDNINTIIEFYNNAHERIYAVFDMIIAKRDIEYIVTYAKALRGYMATEIEKLNGLSGTTAESDLFDQCKYLVLDILDDVINHVELNIIMRRIYYLREVIGQARVEYGL